MVLPAASSRSQLFPRPSQDPQYSQPLPGGRGSLATIAKALAPPPVRSVDVTSGSDPFLTLRLKGGGARGATTVKGFEQPRGGACIAEDRFLEHGEGMSSQTVDAFPGVGEGAPLGMEAPDLPP